MQEDQTITAAGPAGRHQPAREGQPLLFLVLEMERPLALSARVALGGVDVVEIGRGTARDAQRHDAAGLRVLRLDVPDRWMSATHARLDRVLGRWVLADSGSRNGTRLNGEPSPRATLCDGDLFEIGHTLFRFRDGGAPADLPLWADAEQGGAGEPGMETLCPALATEYAKLTRVAGSLTPIALVGESGVGKEVLARAVHRISRRAGSFVPIQCGALPRELVESELFGYRRGAFSGAVEDRQGLVRAANGGTLLLDEIADLPGASQAALLRVVQEREVHPVGADRPVPIDVRFLVATHHDLEERARRGLFRADLLARLGGYQVAIPPLRDRLDDLGLLVGLVLRRQAPGRTRVAFSRQATEALLHYPWPFNVRELERVLARALALAGADPIEREHLPDSLGASAAPPRRLSEREWARRARLEALLREHQGNVSAVARSLGKARQQIQRWLRRYDLARPH